MRPRRSAINLLQTPLVDLGKRKRNGDGHRHISEHTEHAKLYMPPHPRYLVVHGMGQSRDSANISRPALASSARIVRIVPRPQPSPSQTLPRVLVGQMLSTIIRSMLIA